MSKLDLESRMTIKTMLAKGVGASEVARLLQVTERSRARRFAACTLLNAGPVVALVINTFASAI